jgi:hypothetical protein
MAARRVAWSGEIIEGIGKKRSPVDRGKSPV